MSKPRLLSLRQREALPAPLGKLLTKEAFKLPDRKIESKDVPCITLPDDYTIPIADYTTLYGNQNPIWNYKKNESKDVTKSADETKQIETDAKQYEEQFNILIDALKKWGEEKDSVTEQPRINAEVLGNLTTCKMNFFHPNFSGDQTAYYFISIKSNLEKIWYIITQSKTLSEKDKITELKCLCEKIGFCNSGIYTHINDAAFQLTKDSSLDFLLAEMRKNLTDSYSNAFRELNQKRISLASEVHVSTALYTYSSNMNWGPLVDIKKIVEQYDEKFTLVTAEVFTNFHEYFEKSYTPRAILDCIQTHFISNLTREKNLLALKEDKEGWIDYNQDFIDKITLLSNHIDCEWEDFFETSATFQVRFNPDLFKPKFLKICQESGRLFEFKQWENTVLPGGYTVHCFSNQLAWFETTDKKILDWKTLSDPVSVLRSFMPFLAKHRAIRDCGELIKSGNDLLNLLLESKEKDEQTEILLNTFIGHEKLRTIVKNDPNFFKAMDSLPLDRKWQVDSIMRLTGLVEEGFLFDAVRAGNIETFKRLNEYMQGYRYNINIWDEEGLTLLHAAVESGNVDIIYELNKYNVLLDDIGKNPDQTNVLANSPLYLAAKTGRLDIMAALLECKASPNVGNVVFHPNRFVTDNSRPAFLAAESGNVEMLTLLIKYDAELEAERLDGLTLAECAAINGQPKIISLLAEQKVNLTQVNNRSLNLAHLAAKNGKLDVIKELITQKLDLFTVNNQNKTPLELALADLHLLLKVQNKTPLNLAAINNYWDTVREIVKSGLPANWPLIFKQIELYPKLISKLIEWKIEFNKIDDRDRNIIHIAAEAGKSVVIDLVSIFETLNIDVNKVDNDGMTPAHLAISSTVGRISVIQSLANIKADFTLLNKEGKSALDLAVATGQWVLVGGMLKLVNLNITLNMYDTGQQLLFLAIEKGDIASIKTLANYKVDFHSKNRKGVSPADYALTIGQQSVLSTLAEFKAAPTKTVQHSVDEVVIKEQVDKFCKLALQGAMFNEVMQNPKLAVAVLMELKDDENINKKSLGLVQRGRYVLTDAFIKLVKDSPPEQQKAMVVSFINGENLLGQMLAKFAKVGFFKFSHEKNTDFSDCVDRVINTFQSLLKEEEKIEKPEKKI